MDKLTLENLAPYLPYGVELAFIVRNEVRYIDKITGISDIGDYDDIKIKLGYNGSEHIWMFKPILRPISDLSSYNEHFEESWISRLNKECIEFSNAGGIWLDSDLDFDLMYDRCEPPGYLRLEYTSKCRDWLVKNHFDVFGLIQKGIAFDVNQIDNLNLSNN
ncbi:hypothetical protein [Sphingobacterium multivorum]|uniref:hypothetical protein n=1 Tax=Sphingobacterium multivorum TaxID=28454 RepID=UPI003DA43AEC